LAAVPTKSILTAQQGEIAVCLLVQHSNELERKKFEKLPVRLVEFLHTPDRQDYLIFLLRDLNASPQPLARSSA
jgi:hypothetical protein